MRPADPNKYKTTDIFSEGTEGDKEYQRMVQDVSSFFPLKLLHYSAQIHFKVHTQL